MTLAKKMVYLSSAVLLAGAMGIAQTSMSSPQDQDNSTASQAAGAKVRGCLSGSEGNYTVTDNNGTIYHLVGGDAQLQGSVGHEVEITGTPDAQRTGTSDDMAANTASAFQVTGVREIAAGCDHGSRTGTMGTESQPMTERPPTTDRQPKGAPGEGTPPPEPQPHMIAMLQQPGSTDMGSQSSTSQTTSSPSSTTTSSTTTTTTQTPENGSMANTPVTSQTPAEPTSPTGANSQLGTGSTNPSAVSTEPAQTQTPSATTPEPGATANPSATPAPDTSNANPGVNATPSTTTNPTTANPDMSGSAGATANPNTNATPGAAATPGTTASPQSTQEDQNKPLYERQATDIPWATHSGATTTTTTTNPDGASTTTTTTTPQPEPHR